MDCLNPPIEQEPPPDVNWYCPRCPPLEQQVHFESLEPDFIASCPPLPIRESSVASSSRSVPRNDMVKNTKKGKGKALVTDDSDVEVEDEGTPVAAKGNNRRKSRPRGKLLPDGGAEAGDVTMLEPSRPNKRPRLRLSSPVPPSPKPPIIRLRLPARGKGKEREEDPDDSKKGMFDDFLAPEDRDVADTTITNSDKLRCERSRLIADVCLTSHVSDHIVDMHNIGKIDASTALCSC